MREHRYVGFGDTFTYQLYRGCAGIFAVLPEKTGNPVLKAPGKLVRGNGFNFTVSLPGCGRVFHCELIDPAGKCRCQRSLAAPDGNASGEFQIAFNEPEGLWTLRISDVATGVSATQKITVR